MKTITISIDENIWKHLQMLARSYVDRGEDFNPMDYCGENFDDTYALGYQDGEACLASSIIDDALILDT